LTEALFDGVLIHAGPQRPICESGSEFVLPRLFLVELAHSATASKHSKEVDLGMAASAQE
jgi:hypothetical protein